ncbi:hypothetical protein [Actinoplanes sp. NPDC051851]|uniref:hypothetical protein n=1 Tax=Actinoplanes sp. NPDC051851 TaxID=3154753 RepID=UPI00341AC3C0
MDTASRCIDIGEGDPLAPEGRTVAAIYALGDTAEEVGQALLSGGWLGRRRAVASCPVARYLTVVVPGVVDAIVGSSGLTVHLIGGDDIEIALPSAVAGFVLAFDVGVFPELMAEQRG